MENLHNIDTQPDRQNKPMDHADNGWRPYMQEFAHTPLDRSVRQARDRLIGMLGLDRKEDGSWESFIQNSAPTTLDKMIEWYEKKSGVRVGAMSEDTMFDRLIDCAMHPYLQLLKKHMEAAGETTKRRDKDIGEAVGDNAVTVATELMENIHRFLKGERMTGTENELKIALEIGKYIEKTSPKLIRLRQEEARKMEEEMAAERARLAEEAEEKEAQEKILESLAETHGRKKPSQVKRKPGKYDYFDFAVAA